MTTAAEKLEQEETIVRLVKLYEWFDLGEGLDAPTREMGMREVDWLLQTLRTLGFGTYRHTGKGNAVLPPPPNLQGG